MNNQQLIKIFPPYPQHSIHRIEPGYLFNQWLTTTAQVPQIGGLDWGRIRTQTLDALYEDWERFRAEDIRSHL